MKPFLLIMLEDYSYYLDSSLYRYPWPEKEYNKWASCVLSPSVPPFDPYSGMSGIKFLL